MGAKAGIGAQLGVATEGTWGTYAAPTTYYPFLDESLKRIQNYIRSSGLRAGRFVQPEALHVQTTRTIEGQLHLDVLTKSFGKLFNQLHGNTVTPVQIAATTAYRQTHDIGLTVPDGKGLTIQVGRPDVGGTVRAFSYTGCKVLAAEFSCDRGGILESLWTIDGQDETTAQTLGTATYVATAIPFAFTSGTIEFDDVQLVDCVRSAKLNVSLPSEVDRFCLSAAQTKKEPIVNGLIPITAQIEVEFASLNQYTAFTAATRRKFELRFNQGDAGGSNPFACNFTVAKTVTVSEAPVVQGPDVLTSVWTVEAVDDGSAAPLSIEYVSTDTTI